MNFIYYLPHTPGSCFHVNVLAVVLVKRIASDLRVSDSWIPGLILEFRLHEFMNFMYAWMDTRLAGV
jgi:hypothetical protein